MSIGDEGDEERSGGVVMKVDAVVRSCTPILSGCGVVRSVKWRGEYWMRTVVE